MKNNLLSNDDRIIDLITLGVQDPLEAWNTGRHDRRRPNRSREPIGCGSK